MVMVSRNEARLAEALADMVHAEKAWLVATDVTQADQVSALVEQVVERYGRIDLLVNNVGQGLKRELVETSDEDWQFLVQANLTTTFNCCRAVIPVMRRQTGGVIVNIASKSGRRGEGEFAAYCAVKHGVVGLTRALAESERPFGIQVNAVCPGPIATEKMIGMYPDADRSQWSTPEQVAEAVIYLATPASHAMCGKTLDLF